MYKPIVHVILGSTVAASLRLATRRYYILIRQIEVKNRFSVNCKLSFLLIISLIVHKLAAQDIPIGAWRTHSSYRSVQTLAVAPGRVYAGAPGSFFLLDTQTGETNTFSRLDGFSGTAISKLAYEPQTQVLLIPYEDGTIDLLQNNNLFTINAIAIANTITANKKTAHILLQNNLAYLSYDFGVVVVDLQRRHIRATYQNLGPAGTELAICGTAILNNRIYLATENGILTAPLTGVNLQDFANWQIVPSTVGVPNGAATHIAAYGGKVYAAFSTNELYESTGNSWQKVAGLPIEPVLFLKRSGQYLLAGYRHKIVSLENQKKPVTITHPLIQLPQDADYGDGAQLWIADAVNGLIRNEQGDFRSYAPNGTVTNVLRRLARWQTEVVALPGGYTDSFAPRLDSSGFSVFTSNGWQNSTPYNSPTTGQMPKVKDLLATAYNPVNQEKYLGSFGNGLLIKKPESNWQLLNEPDSPPANARVTGLVTDTEGTLWVTVFDAAAGQPSLYARQATGTWQRYIFNNFTARQPIDMLRDDSGYLWMPLAQGGIWVFDPVSNRGRLLSMASGQGSLPNNRVFALEKDAQGQLWVGTGRGVAYFFNPGSVFDNQPFDAITPVFEGRQVLRDEVVTAIRIDGGNRKWFGTRNGAWLFDAGITRQLGHFTTRNTPLLSDHILDMEIQPMTGEIFFATDAGLISYRGTATEATPVHTNVRVFPNPVRPEFDGTIGISGLAINSVVKITDVSGRLVFQTRASGGTAVWNGRDYTGRRAASGVYLIFSSSDDGTEKVVAKIAVIE